MVAPGLFVWDWSEVVERTRTALLGSQRESTASEIANWAIRDWRDWWPHLHQNEPWTPAASEFVEGKPRGRSIAGRDENQEPRSLTQV